MKYQNFDLPLYRSHKIVGALKIATCKYLPGTSECEVTFEDQQFQSDYMDVINKPHPGDGWYIVWYEDGYWSFSPPEPFEQGYDRIEESIAR